MTEKRKDNKSYSLMELDLPVRWSPSKPEFNDLFIWKEGAKVNPKSTSKTKNAILKLCKKAEEKLKEKLPKKSSVTIIEIAFRNPISRLFFIAPEFLSFIYSPVDVWREAYYKALKDYAKVGTTGLYNDTGDSKSISIKIFPFEVKGKRNIRKLKRKPKNNQLVYSYFKPKKLAPTEEMGPGLLIKRLQQYLPKSSYQFVKLPLFVNGFDEGGEEFIPRKNQIGNAFVVIKGQPKENSLKICLEAFASVFEEELIPTLQCWILRNDFYEAVKPHALHSAVAAIMARNMSHNIGSHVLAGLSGDDLGKREHISVLHSYLQQRMDFIATITSEWTGVGELMLFYEDVIKGFLSETMLLNKIVVSHSYNSENIKFVVKCPYDSKEITFSKNKGKDYAASEDYRDFFINIPGGQTGAHALYIILENIIRNSAKYGKSAKEFTLHIKTKLNEKMGRYEVLVWDNLSKIIQRKKTLVEEMEKKIQTSIVSVKTGERIKENYGIAEMKIAADMLFSPARENDYVHVDKKEKTCPIWPEEVKSNGKKFLGYRFLLQLPAIIALVNEKNELPEVCRRLGIYKFSNLGELIAFKHAFQFVVIEINKRSNLNEIINTIKNNHRKLPYRIMIAGKNSQLSKIKTQKERIKFIKPFKLPKGDNENNWKNFIIDIYKKWLDKKKTDNNLKQCNLLLSFHRVKSAGEFERWKEIKKIKLSGDFPDIYLSLTSIDNKGNVKVDKIYNKLGQELKSLTENKKWMLYDNHGNMKKVLKNEDIIFSQPTGSSMNALRIFNTLAHPPKEEFLLKFLLLGLLEAGIAKILIVDERVTEHILYGSGKGLTKDDGKWKKYVNAGCFPVSFIKIGRKEKGLSNLIDNYKNEITKRITLDLSSGKVVTKDKNIPKKFDLIIIHQGVIDEKIKPDLKKEDQQGWVEKLYKLTPRVIITSGRGKMLRNVPDDIPFIEYSFLKDTLVRDFSKYHLCRSLLGITGGE